MQKILKKYLFGILLSLVFIVCNFNPISASAEEKIKLKVSAGFDSTYKIGGTVPINIEIENSMKNINGEVQIEMENGDRSSGMNTNLVSVYAQPISLPLNSTKKLVMNVPINKYVTKIKVNIVDGKSTVFEKDMTIPGGLNSDSVLIGILSDEYDSISYVNSVSMGNGNTLSAKNVKMTETSFPEDIDVLKMFNNIIINNFDTSKLNKNQYDTLKKWVSNGGNLIIGTGPSHNKTLAIFKDDFVSGTIGNVTNIATKELGGLIAKTNPGDKLQLNALDIKVKDSTPLLKEGDFVLVHKLEKNRGTVAVAAFDFGINPIANWGQKTTFMEKLIGETLPSYYSLPEYQKGRPSMMMQYFYGISNAVKSIPELPMPKGKNLIIIFIIYIIIAAPINYVVLKKLDRRELMWATVPIISVAFAGVMYAAGLSTRVTEPMVNIISMIKMDSYGTADINTYGGVVTPTKGTMKIEAADGMHIKTLTENIDYHGSVSTTNKNPKVVDAKINLGAKPSIEFYKNGVFSNRLIDIDMDELKSGKIEGSINYANGVFKGTVKNNSGFDLEDCYIVTTSNYITLGNLKNGETREINDKPTGTYSGYGQDLIGKIYKDPYRSQQQLKNASDEEAKQMRINRQKWDVMSNYFQMNMGKTDEQQIIAWSKTPITKDIVVNGKKVKKIEKSFITAPIVVTLRNGNTVEYPYGYIRPTYANKNNKGGYDEYGKVFYGGGTYELQYKIDNTIKIEQVDVKANFSSNNIANKEVKQYLWNVKTASYEEGDYTSFSIQKDNIAKYVDKDGTLKIKLEIMNTNQVNGEIPSISVKGSVK